MKNPLLLTMLGFSSLQYVAAQTLVANEITLRPLDSSIKKESLHPRILADTKKITENPAYSFKNLFESDAADIAANSGPRLNPRAVSFVQDYVSKHADDLIKMKVWGRPFFDMMDGVFIENNLPRELKYIAVIESRLNASSSSFAGAVGPWQFMPATAIRMGLKVSRHLDERTNYIKSTQAAAKYLTRLYEQFGDWLLVIAAYNGGPGNVLKAIRKAHGSLNFWDIQYFLPAESRNHVKKFIGTHYIFEGQGGLTTLTRAESNDHYGTNGGYEANRRINEEETANAKEQTISGRYHSLVIAKNLLMDVADFNRYNPEFDKIMASSKNTYQLKLPSEKMDVFLSHKNIILSESIQLLLNNTVPPADQSLKKS